MLSDGERLLSSIEVVQSVEPMDADNLEAVLIRGWRVVVKKGEFMPGDKVVFIEVDAALPLSDPRFEFLGARGTKTVGGQKVHVLRTAKLRGVYSQGIVFPISEFPELTQVAPEQFDHILGIFKYEPPAPFAANAKGNFPRYLHKTDAERVQNLSDEDWAVIQGEPVGSWIPTEKVDGSSVTIWRDTPGKAADTLDPGLTRLEIAAEMTTTLPLRVASRNLELVPTDTGAHVQAARKFVAPHLLPGQWVQAEVAGPGIQGNTLKLPAQRLFVFGFGNHNSTDMSGFQPLPLADWPQWAQQLAPPRYDLPLPASQQDAIKQVDKLKSLVNPAVPAEGIVWTHRDAKRFPQLGDRYVWKSINPYYLLKHGG